MCWFWTAIFLGFTLLAGNLSDARHHPEKPPSSAAVVVGTVYCDTCFQQDNPNANRFIAGATVAIECKNTATTPHFRQEVTTNNLGQFQIQLPFHVSRHLKTIQGCSITLLRTNHPFCAATAAPAESPLHLKSTTQHKQIFSAGFPTFKPQACNNAADQKSSPRMAFLLPPNPLLPPPTLIPPILPSPPPSLFPPVFPTPPASVIPPILPTPSVPTPSLPIPTIPGIPSLPIPPIPGLPSPSLPTPSLPLPSIPGMPSLPVPPIPGLPSLPLPQIPGLVPSPPPPPPSFPLPIPPVPFLPPLIPGGPPAEVSSPARTSQP